MLAYNLTLIIKCVYRGAFLHAFLQKKSVLLSRAQNVCLLILNEHRYLAQSDANPQNTDTYSSSQCDELSVPIRLGIIVSLRFESSLPPAPQPSLLF